MTRDHLAAMEFARGDITDLTALESVLATEQMTHVVHLAAMLIPWRPRTRRAGRW